MGASESHHVTRDGFECIDREEGRGQCHVGEQRSRYKGRKRSGCRRVRRASGEAEAEPGDGGFEERVDC